MPSENPENARIDCRNVRIPEIHFRTLSPSRGPSPRETLCVAVLKIEGRMPSSEISRVIPFVEANGAARTPEDSRQPADLKTTSNDQLGFRTVVPFLFQFSSRLTLCESGVRR
jgi:hypothetical protein